MTVSTLETRHLKELHGGRVELQGAFLRAIRTRTSMIG